MRATGAPRSRGAFVAHADVSPYPRRSPGRGVDHLSAVKPDGPRGEGEANLSLNSRDARLQAAKGAVADWKALLGAHPRDATSSGRVDGAKLTRERLTRVCATSSATTAKPHSRPEPQPA